MRKPKIVSWTSGSSKVLGKVVDYSGDEFGVEWSDRPGEIYTYTSEDVFPDEELGVELAVEVWDDAKPTKLNLKVLECISPSSMQSLSKPVKEDLSTLL